MSISFQSLTKEAKECYLNFFSYYNTGKYSEALVNARKFVEYIAKVGIFEICDSYYRDLFQDLEKKTIIRYKCKDYSSVYYAVDTKNINRLKKSENNEKVPGLILKGREGLVISQIDNNIIQNSFSFSFESSNLIKILGNFIEQINPEAYTNFTSSNTLLHEIFKKSNPGAHSGNKTKEEEAANCVYLLLQTCVLNLNLFCNENANTFLLNTALFLNNLVNNTKRTNLSIPKTPDNKSAQQHHPHNGYGKQIGNAIADINKHKEEELRRKQEVVARRAAEQKRLREDAIKQQDTDFYKIFARERQVAA